VAALVDARLVIAQLGDTRAYLLRGDRLAQVTRDHTLLAEIHALRALSVEEADAPPRPDPTLIAQGAILELLRLRTHAYKTLGDPPEAFARRLAEDLVRDEEMPLCQVLIGVWQASCKPERVASERAAFVVGCIRVLTDVKSLPVPVKRILKRAELGQTAESVPVAARAPPQR
jgi:hypothetical protein